MRKSVEQLEHTEEFKRAVESCKAERKAAGKDPENCFAITTKSFNDANKPIYKNKGSKQSKQGLTSRNVQIYAEFGGQ